GDDGALKRFDADLTDDWTDIGKTTGAPVDLDRISGMIAFEQTGYESTLDNYILRLKAYAEKSSLDVSIIHLRGMEEVQNATISTYAAWDVTEWGESAGANLSYTDILTSPQRLSWKLGLPKKGHYFQVRWRNNRSEKVEIYGETFIGRASGEV